MVFRYPFLSIALVSVSLNSYAYKLNHNRKSAFDITPGMQKVFSRADCIIVNFFPFHRLGSHGTGHFVHTGLCNIFALLTLNFERLGV